jgi:2-polyprenyl-3-methyl-5-hydroxy-6-metoxy-1,4-benzoquinol methylase
MLLSDDREIYGIELNEAAAQKAAAILQKVYTGTIEDALGDLPDQYFDAIVFNDVLEHLLIPWNVCCIELA